MAIHSKSPTPGTSAWRVAGVVGLSTCLMATSWLLATLAFRDVPSVIHRVPGPDALVVVAAEVAGALVACWLSLGVLVTVVTVLAGIRPTVPVLPSSLRRLVVGLLSASSVMVVAVPANAAVSPAPAASTQPATTVDPLDPGWTPSSGPASGSRPTTPPESHAPHSSDTGKRPGTAHSRPRATATTVTVHRGDTLWDIARRQLDTGSRHATPDEVARAWPRWFHTNERVIGHDPDRLEVGVHLHRPGSD